MIVKEKGKRKDQIIKELKSEVSDVNTSVKNLENQLNREEQYSRRNCIYIYIYMPLQDMELQEYKKKKCKTLQHTENLFRKKLLLKDVC